MFLFGMSISHLLSLGFMRFLTNQDIHEHELHTFLIVQSIYILPNCDFPLNIVFALIEGSCCDCFRLCRQVYIAAGCGFEACCRRWCGMNY